MEPLRFWTRSRRRVALLAGLVAASTLAAGWYTQRRPVVDVVRPVRREVREVVVASGRLEAARTTRVSPRISGAVRNVLVAQGDRVRQGQVLVVLEADELEEDLRQAAARVATAAAELQRLLTGPPAEDLTQAAEALRAAVRAGGAQVRAAEQRLQDLQQGRPEAVRVAESLVAQARAAAAAAQAELEAALAAADAAASAASQAEADARRTRALVAAGALAAADTEKADLQASRLKAEELVARRRVDAARARTLLAQQQLAAAERQLELARRPASEAQIQAARRELQALQARVRAEIATAQARWESLLKSPRPVEVRVARARYREALEALRAAQRRLAAREVRAPFSGVVVEVFAQTGQTVAPGTALLTLADPTSVQVVVDLDEQNLARLRAGQNAWLLPPEGGSPVRARVGAVDPQVDVQRGTVRVRLSVPPGAFGPTLGRTVDVSVELGYWPESLAVPVGCLQQSADAASVLVLVNGRAVRREVRVLGRNDRWAAVAGLDPTDLVVLRPDRLRPGSAARARVVLPKP